MRQQNLYLVIYLRFSFPPVCLHISIATHGDSDYVIMLDTFIVKRTKSPGLGESLASPTHQFTPAVYETDIL